LSEGAKDATVFIFTNCRDSLYTQENGEKVEGRADEKILNITIIVNSKSTNIL
jgi:hypothetical protein